MEKLPLKYDYEKYNKFISIFGTHMTEEMIVGGVLE